MQQPRPHDVDVLILGGGMAGLTAAVQLHQDRPQTSICLVEKREFPIAATAAHKVGESCAEVAAHYLKDELGLTDYLEANHHRKMGLRWFCANGDNTDLTRRVEFGLSRFSPLANFHVDRGSLENHLAGIVQERGIDVRDGTRVVDVDLRDDDEPHVVTLDHGGERTELRARWVLDATGRQALLRRKLGLTVDLPINASSSWWRVPYNMVIDEWSDDQAWRDQVPSGTRWKSTVSLLGEGYWCWVINLGSGSTSVGVVADPRYVPFERIRRYDAALDFLREKEPQLASKLPESEDGLLDFLKRKDFAVGVTRAFSRHRWALTGEAAAFLDPLFSTGLDFAAISNTLAIDLMKRDLDGASERDLRHAVRVHNRSYLGVAQIGIDVFAGQLVLYRDPQATAAKFLWDNAAYFMILLNLFRNGLIQDADYVRSLSPYMRRHALISSFMQHRFREWSAEDFDARSAGIPILSDFVVTNLFTTPQRTLDKEELREHIDISVRRLHTMAVELCTRMSEAAGRPCPEIPPGGPEPVDEELLIWSPFDRRTAPPAEQEPQPEEGWLLR